MRLGLIIMLCLPWTGCSGGPPPTAPLPERARPVDPAPLVHWRSFDASQAWPTTTEDWFPAQGHYGGTYEAIVRVTPDARERYQQHTLGSRFEAGTTLIMLHRSRGTRKLGPVHAMQRDADGWHYLKLSAEGGIEEQGELPLCARCHAEATSDSVFGPPRRAVDDPSQSEAKETSHGEATPEE